MNFDPYMETLFNFFHQHYVVLLAALGIVCFVISWDILNPLRVQKVREENMRRQREREVKRIISDAVTEMLYDLVEQKKITILERNQWFVNFGTRCGLPDLLPKYDPKHPDVEDLKKTLRYRTKTAKVFGDLKIATKDK